MAFGRSISACKLLAGIGALVGIPTTCYGGFCIYDATLPTNGFLLSSEGYIQGLPSPEKMEPVHHVGDGRWKIDRFDCFERFFPGVEKIEENTHDVGTSGLNNNITIENKGESKVPIGCLLSSIKLTDKNNFTHRAEITVKNEDFGWAVWIRNHRSGVPQKTEKGKNAITGKEQMEYDYTLWTYHFLFLSKTSEGKWKIKVGYYLSDSYYFSNNHQVSITLPAGLNLLSVPPKSTSFSFLWIPSSNGREVFEDIKVKYGNSFSWLGKRRSTNNLFNASDINLRFLGLYNPTDRKWHTTTNPTISSITVYLDQYYSPFRGWSGKWLPIPQYCDTLSSFKSAHPEDLNRLKTFCYRPKSSSS